MAKPRFDIGEESTVRIKILDKTRNELKIEVEGEGHTFCNVLQEALLKDERVDLAGYDIAHPLTANPTIYLRTKGRSKPEVALRDAAREVQKSTEAFTGVLEDALKTWQK